MLLLFHFHVLFRDYPEMLLEIDFRPPGKAKLLRSNKYVGHDAQSVACDDISAILINILKKGIYFIEFLLVI